MDTMSRDQEESYCAIQSKLDAILRNSINQDKSVAKKKVKQPGIGVEFAEWNRKQQKSTPLRQIHNIIESETGKSATKQITSNSTPRVPCCFLKDASHLKRFPRETRSRANRRDLQETKESKDNWDGCIDT